MHISRRQTGTFVSINALFPKGKTMPYEPQLAPDLVFLRNPGIALLALTIAVGGITIFGFLKVNDPLPLTQSVAVGPQTGLVLKQIERHIFLRKMLQAQYVNPKAK
jgi:hypothetical protein